MVVVDSFNLDVVRQPRLPVDVGREAVLRVEEIRVRTLEPQGAGNGDHQALKISVEPERHFLQVHRFDDAAGVRAVGLKQGRRADHRHRLLDRPDLQPHVHAHRGVDRYLDPFTNDALESRQLRDHAIRAVFEVREDVVAGFVGGRSRCDVGVHLGNGDAHAWQRATRTVDDVPDKRSLHRLRRNAAGAREHEHGQRRARAERTSQPTHRTLLTRP